MSDKNKIFLVIQPQVTNVIGGAITVFINLSNMLVKNGYDVYGICYNEILGKPSSLNEEVKFINLYEEYSDLNFSQAINKKTEEVSPNLIIFFFPFLYVDANLSEKFSNIPRILMFHSRPDIYFKFNDIKDELEPLYCNTTAQILFDSYKKFLPEFIKSENVITIPNGLKQQNKTINTNTEHKKIIYLSRIDLWKGHKFLIKSFKLIAPKYPDWTIDIYGQSEPPEFEEELKKLVKEKKIENQIFFKGITSNPTETMLNYDFCVFPSYLEGFPLGLTEAQSVGLPCIGLKGCSGVNELIINDYNGYLAEEKIEDFAQKIEKLILSKETRTLFSKNAKISAEKYNSEIINKKWIDIIEKIINKIPIESVSTSATIAQNDFFPIDRIISTTHRKLKWYQYIFSIKNQLKYKILTILGIKIKYKRKKKNNGKNI